MKKIRYALRFDYKTCKGEDFTLPSETIPDQAMSVPEMIRRTKAGLPVTGVRVPFYSGEDYIPDFDRMDISELVAFREQNEAVISRFNEEVKAREREAYRKKIEEAYEAKKAKEEKLGGRQATPSADASTNQ